MVSIRRGHCYRDKDGNMIKLGGRNLSVSLNEQELKLIANSANKKGVSISAFVRMSALEKARE